MSFARVSAAGISGASVLVVQIEVDIQPGLPVFEIIGLPDKRIDEARFRIKSAFKNSRIDFPLGKITVNLSPSHIPKQGTGFDLGVAVGILIARAQFPPLPLSVWVLGELSLDGFARPVEHILAFLIESLRKECQGCLIPSANLKEAEAIGECRVLGVETLSQLVSLLQRPLCFSTPAVHSSNNITKSHFLIDEVIGQLTAKRGLEIVLAGGHNVLKLWTQFNHSGL